tara:strand:+ start:320 stop:583 length:264 start_codon:yes stop_codon:yes gene_type:complete
MYSFKYTLTLYKLARMHRGTKRVVRITKNNEIPSTPIKKFMFDEGIHKNSSTNWNFAVDRSNRTHRKVDRKNVSIEKDNAILRILSK